MTCALSGTSVSPSPGITCCTASCPATVNFREIALGRSASARAGTVIVYVEPRTSPGKSGWNSKVRALCHAYEPVGWGSSWKSFSGSRSSGALANVTVIGESRATSSPTGEIANADGSTTAVGPLIGPGPVVWMSPAIEARMSIVAIADRRRQSQRPMRSTFTASPRTST